MSWSRGNAIKLLLIMSIVSLVPTCLKAQENDRSSYLGLNLDTEILKGEKAPFGGVLISWPQYYYYNSSVEKVFEMETRIPPEPESPYWTYVQIGVVFFLIGLAADDTLDLLKR
jgi:hypothetical protein